MFHDLESGEPIIRLSAAMSRIERHNTALDAEDADAYLWALDAALVGPNPDPERAEELLEFLDATGAGLEWRA